MACPYEHHKPDSYLFDPKNLINTYRLKGTEKLRGEVLNWCKIKILNFYLKEAASNDNYNTLLDHEEVAELGFIVLKKIFDYVIFTGLDGCVKQDDIILIGCGCSIITIKLIFKIFKVEKVWSELYDSNMRDKISYMITWKKYSASDIYNYIKWIMEEINKKVNDEDEETFYIYMGGLVKKYKDINELISRYTIKSIEGYETYENPKDKKWQLFLQKTNDLFMKAMYSEEFIMGFNKSKFAEETASSNEIIEKIESEGIFSLIIECANEIMEDVVFNSFGNRLSKYSYFQNEFAFACLLLAVKQQGADYIYRKNKTIPDHLGWYAELMPEDLIKLEKIIAQITNWKGCPNVESRIESIKSNFGKKNTRKTKNIRKSKTKNIRKSKTKKSKKTRKTIRK